MCLARSAHGLVPNHPIFRGPFPVGLQFDEEPTPANYRHFPDGVALPATLPVWRVDTTDYTRDKSLQPGAVASGYGFADSPDAEVIANGINSKGPGGVALGRHASFFLWGFAAEPTRMTPAGRNAFLNAICYVQRFDHEPMLVQRKASGREWHVMRAMKDPATLAQAQKDLEYVRADGRNHVVDDDCKALSLSNRNVALLEHCIGAWERGEDVERCQRLLARYTDREFATAGAWRAWLTANHANLFFSDVGGFRYFVRPADAKTRARESTTTAGGAGDAVALGMSVLEAEAKAGSVITIAVRFVHAGGWHSYASVPDDSPYRATSLVLDLPAGWTTVGHWSLPDTVTLAEDGRVQTVEGDAVFLQRVRVGGAAPAGKVKIGVRAAYLVCDAERCLPPAEAKLSAEVAVVK